MFTLSTNAPRRSVRSSDSTPDHTEPDGDRQPREHAVLCSRCLKPTFNLSGVCGREHA